MSQRKKKKKKRMPKTKTKKKRQRRRKKPPVLPEAPPDESVADMILRHSEHRRKVSGGRSAPSEIGEKLKDLEEKPLPDTMSPQAIEEELDELLESGEQ